jgi:UDP-GlcNAc:undecaprenyl-phosphate GlcNAc-1-phosphate transferase
MTPGRLLLAAAVSLIVAFVVDAIVRHTALRMGAVVPTRPDRWHRTPTPTFGGIGVMAGLVAGCLVGGALVREAIPVLAAGAALFAVGWYDDHAPLSALAKMVNSLAVAAFFVISLTGFGATPVHAALVVVAVIWFGGIDNAINLLDNMDGLAAGVTALAAIGLAATFPAELGPALVTVLITLAGGLIGFLIWNRHPAKLFMGNCGSLAIGGIVAACATTAVARAGTGTAAAAAAVILVVPIFDSTFVVLLRRLAGRSTTRGNIDHTSHRLVSAGFSEPAAVAMLYVVGAAGAAIGYTLYKSGPSLWPLAAGFAVAVLMMCLYLARVPAYAGQDFQALQNAPIAPLLSDLTFRWHAGEVLLDLILITTCYYAAYRIRFDGAELSAFLASFSASLPAIIGCQLAALYLSGLYSRIWSTFGLHDLSTVIKGVGGGLVFSVLAIAYLFRFDERFSRSVFLIDAVLLVVAIVATRVSFRVFGRIAVRTGSRQRRVAICGAGGRGQLLVREMLAEPAWDRNPVAFFDDDPGKRSLRMMGVPVRGGLDDLDAFLEKLGIEEVLISSAAIGEAREGRVRQLCAARGIPVRRLFLDIK